MKKLLLISIPIILIAAGIYLWALMGSGMPDNIPDRNTSEIPSFNPLNRSSVSIDQGGITNATPTGISEQPIIDKEAKIPRLRQLSVTPVGGYMASSTASSTVVRFVDRGVGHVYDASSVSAEIPKISNTTIPRVYESYWNANGNNAIFRYMKDETGTIVNFFAELRVARRNGTSTDANALPYEVKGKFLSSTIQSIAVSPKADKIFTLEREGGRTTGSVSGLDESKKREIITIPLTQVQIEWPEENTVALTTNASGLSSGFLYFIDLKKPALKKIIGNVTGLTTKVSPDAKRVLYSATTPQGLIMYVRNNIDNSNQEVIIRTIADKCVWSKLEPTEAYCAVPVERPRGLYPDDWYKGVISFVDQVWHINTVTGEVRLVADLLKQSDTLIDVINPKLDPEEKYLYFMNKENLTLWSLELDE